MPEGSEIHIFASLINRNCQGKTFLRVSQTNWPKNANISLPWSEFRLSAVARGKELQITCVPALELPGARPVVYTFNHGLVGMWDWVVASSLAKAPAGTQLMFHTATHSLVYMDKMKMGGWQETADWGKGRGPDPLLEFFDFCNHTVSLIHKKEPSHLICVTLIDQTYFNGIGNYLRAEILNRAGLDPFQPTMNVFRSTPKNITLQTFASIISEATSDPSNTPSLKKSLKHDPGLMVLWLARQIQMEVIAGGMNKYGSADEQAKFHKWLRVYGKGSEVKVAGRSVHCTPEQRLGKQERDLGVFINRYPYELSGLFYKNPTLTIAPETGSSTVSSSSSSTSIGALPSAPSVSGGTFNVKRVEENIVSCHQIVTMPIPMISKLLLATTSLSRSGKLNFMEESSVRETLLDEHPVAYSAWQVFEANGDEDDLVDTLKRLANSTAPMRKQREAWANALSAQLASLTIPQQQPVQAAVAAKPAPKETSPAAAIKHSWNPNFSDLPKLGKSAKRDRLNDSRSSNTSSSASSVDGDNASDDDHELSPPSKKKMPSSFAKVKSSKKKSKFDPPANLKSGGTGLFGKISPSASPSPSSSAASSLDLVQLLGDKSWLAHLSSYLKSTKQLQELCKFLAAAYLRNDPPVYPPMHDIFNAFKLCPLDQVKVVILGQDPYHGPGQAHGLCFSVLRPVAPPPSLVNIFKELETDIPGFKSPNHGDLTSWANQGVFLLNTVLTVFQQKPNSHANMGWEGLTDLVIKIILEQRKGVVFMLWGGMAQKKSNLISKYQDHYILSAPHPSPLSAFNGWFGCKHFSKANTMLLASGQSPVDWNIAN